MISRLVILLFSRPVILLLAIAPAFALLWYGIRATRGTWKSEALWTAFFMGCLSALGIVAAEMGIGVLLHGVSSSPVTNAALKALFEAAIPEESVKFLVLICMALRHVDVRREQDTIVLALAVSLGFAAMENFFYVAWNPNWASVGLLRALTAVPGHGLNGLAMGAMVTLARLSRTSSPWIYASALAFPISLHAVYDFYPMLADQYEDVFLSDLIWQWATIMGLSAIFVIVFCNRVIAEAAVADALRPERAPRFV